MRKKISAISLIVLCFMGINLLCINAYATENVVGYTNYEMWDNEAAPAAPMPTPEPTPTPTPVATSYTETKIGSAYTTYGVYAAQANRNNNMSLASKAIDYAVINPGETFSFNQTVGPRTAQRGYKEAPIFVGDKKVPGLGGGICQISSTLYMAVKNTGLQVVERHRHSMPVTYCKPEDEATVSWGYLDFKFKNNLAEPVRIEAYCNGGVVRITFYKMTPVY